MTEPTTLLDASVLIALAVEGHVHHDAAEQWSLAHAAMFATCPITQGILVRFLVRAGASGGEARSFLVELLSGDRHRFWPADLAFEAVDLGSVVGHRQVTDAYLAGLARFHHGRLATFDRGVAAVHPDVADLMPT